VDVLLWILVVIGLLAVVVFWIWGLFDVILRGDLSGGAKVLWIVPMLLLPGFVTLLYVVVGRRGRSGGDALAPE
jgi:Phospholipase_D-nuclease N-terminal